MSGFLSPTALENHPSGGSKISGRERKDPSVTPRKFRRFFTPRNLERLQKSSAKQALYDVTRPYLNRKGLNSSPVRPSQGLPILDSSPPEGLSREPKRRKRYNTPERSPNTVNPKGQSFVRGHIGEIQDAILQSSPCERAARFSDRDEFGEESRYSRPFESILPIRNRGLSGQIFERSIGNPLRSGYKLSLNPINNFQDHTASFYSKPNDVHLSLSLDGQGRTIPFCAAACNTNSLVAIGDQEGRVRLLEAGDVEKSMFKDLFLSFRVHQNAIIDMNFSENDTRLVTASGDQSSRVVDMNTQTTISILGAHTASLKQARFQPGRSNNDVIATSGRDGTINLWDLRCKGYDKPLIQIHAPVESDDPHPATRKTHYCALLKSINDAHKAVYHLNPHTCLSDIPKYGEFAGRPSERLGDVSVTAIQFLPLELSHLLLSASEADSSVKLWDIRKLQTARRHRNMIPLASTSHPESHSKWRHFGVSSISLSGDGARIYTLSKDNTVYVYSTAHLMLGQAPNLIPTDKGRSPLHTQVQEGLGPLYGFRHPKFIATSFYVKSAIRKAKDSMCEMLAVGSSDGCAVVFPTDERYLPFQNTEDSFRHLRENWSRVDDRIPISTNGTALIRGHDREVGSLTWAESGSLITVGDDYLVRAWREGDQANNLRIGGESEGKRWNCGWADVDDRYDED